MSASWLSRRQLLQATGAMGGLLVSFHLPRAQAALRPSRSFQPNAWLVITPEDRYLFRLDRSEMGQGVMTALPVILAEELEVEPSRLEVQFAPAERRYDNPKTGSQNTSGSLSVSAAWSPLREAGALARERLRQAAACRWEVPRAECQADNGTIVHRPTGRRLRYGELAEEARRVWVDLPALKSPAQFKYLGKSRGRVDALAKSRGQAVFGLDVQMPKLLTAVVLRPPVWGGKLKRFDAREAHKLSGVVEVVAIPRGVGVVARTFWQAKRAANAVQVEWDGGLQAGLSSEQLRAQHEKACAEGPFTTAWHQGDAEGAIASAARVLEARYEAPYLAHATMEPMNCTAWVEKHRCQLWVPTQAQGGCREVAARITGLAQERVAVHTTFLGGGFGRRASMDFVEEAVWLSKEMEQPVKVVWTREDDTRHGPFRPASYHCLRAGLDREGNLVGWHHRLASQSVVSDVLPGALGAMLPEAIPYCAKDLLAEAAVAVVSGWDPTSSEGASHLAYQMPAVKVEYARVEAAVPVTIWRSVGYSFNTFVVESFLDECAHAAGKDPFEYRRSLLSLSHRQRWVLELAAEKAGWGSALPPGRFRGIAQSACFGSYAAAVAEVSVEGGQIRVHRVVLALDCGQVVNPDGVAAQLEGSALFGLSAALKQRITIAQGQVEQSNFHDYPMLRMNEAPKVETYLRPNEAEPGGVGEPGVPVMAPAVANAVFAATGKRLRSLPLTL